LRGSRALNKDVRGSAGPRCRDLVVQGAPGTGKTYRGARMAVAALWAGRRVGITAQSHAAIQNLLEAIEDHPNEIGFEFSGVYKGDGIRPRRRGPASSPGSRTESAGGS
jgi:hypothetical protein